MAAERSAELDDSGVSKEERIQKLLDDAMKILNDYTIPSDSDFDNGISLLMEAFKLGSIEAAYQIGWNYSIPNESHYDIDVAVKYLTIAAEADHPRAIVKLATYYFNTEDTEQHIREQRALSLLDKIKDTSNRQAQYLKGMIYLNGMATIDCNIKNAIRCLSNAAYNKHVDAMLKLGFLYKDGLNVRVGYDINDVMYLKKNPCEAAKHFHAAASAGSATGQYEYAKMLLDGIGVTQSYVYAFYYLWSAAKQKHGKAQFELAKLYSSGYIFPEDYKTAYIWALISQSFSFQEETNRFIESLKPKLTKHEVSSLQVKAYRYKDIVIKAGTKDTPLLQEPNEYFAKNCYQEDSKAVSAPGIYAKETMPIPSQPQNPDNLNCQFAIDNINNLTLCYYVKDRNITFICNGSKKTYKAPTMLNANCLELLTRYNKQTEHNEPQIGYYAADIYDATSAKERSNRQIVSDFNHALRKHFRLGKEVKPFEWIGKGKTRSLKANFTLKVKY